MRVVFADSAFYIAAANPKDILYASAKRFASQYDGMLVTSEYVLVEVGNWFAGSPARAAFPLLMERLREDERTTVLPSEHTLFLSGVALYTERPDKGWSLTDCISFVVMRERGIGDALTGDHHFEQAGFVALLKQAT